MDEGWRGSLGMIQACYIIVQFISNATTDLTGGTNYSPETDDLDLD